ncbi:serum paraoxonase/arylesterase 2-like [Syngnathus acus]|uniref:serum paraoxonase/arylesterase 2-like n=1 Tax=Syngnathus acus TaxID=161584 RepID=UPI001885B800|nr:serum paraoxonase/arylesterase 2-like [Syngnathus acus]
MGKCGLVALFVAALSVLLGERIVNLRKRALASRELVKNHLPNCAPLKNLNDGSEDITVFGDGFAFVSTGLKYPGVPSSDAPGKIFFLDLKDSPLRPIELRMARNFDLETFNPHGISVYIDPTEEVVYLFVVSHPDQNSQVELFKFVEEELSLMHLKTFKHDLLHSVNDIVALGKDHFYATNDHYFSNQCLKALEFLLAQPWTNVVYYSEDIVKIVSQGYYMANGINVSPDERHVYVMDVLDHKVHVLERKEDNGLAFVKAIDVGSLCDNIEVDPITGDLWLGCHPNGWKALNVDPNDPAGSEVIRIQNIHSEEPSVKQMFADDGHMIMGSSVATTYGDKVLIGSIFHKAICCDLE